MHIYIYLLQQNLLFSFWLGRNKEIAMFGECHCKRQEIALILVQVHLIMALFFFSCCRHFPIHTMYVQWPDNPMCAPPPW